jgi:hypothetical protein
MQTNTGAQHRMPSGVEGGGKCQVGGGGGEGGHNIPTGSSAPMLTATAASSSVHLRTSCSRPKFEPRTVTATPSASMVLGSTMSMVGGK